MHGIFSRFWPYTRSHRKWLILALAARAGRTGGGYGRHASLPATRRRGCSYPTTSIRSRRSRGSPLLAFVGAVVSFADDYLSTLAGERFVLDLRTSLFRHLHDLSLDFFERRRLGDMISRLTGDVGAIETLVLSGVASRSATCSGSRSSLRRSSTFGGISPWSRSPQRRSSSSPAGASHAAGRLRPARRAAAAAR